QSQVWLTSRNEGGRLYFDADSDAFIVKGLLAVVLAAYNGRTPEEILAFDIEDYFSRLNLLKHLSVTRGKGWRARVERIRDTAQAAGSDGGEPLHCPGLRGSRTQNNRWTCICVTSGAACDTTPIWPS